ncbi:hypothetical protein BKA70DRAFT_1438041 [Coprinopsis sp. MPI-PUGE-AT-0042]|nr:hypothetical protein BKA70DRAFT_1438041 [Coprinopsis sp. MPI-PUGE-AT-0042]
MRWGCLFRIRNPKLQDDGSVRNSVAGRETLKQLARAMSYFKRNRPHVYSYVQGECK